MNKTLLALAAIVLLGLGTIQASAMMLPPPDGPRPPCAGPDCGGGGPGPDGDPTPDPCIIHCGPGDGPDPHDEADKAAEVCNAALGKLRKVTEEQVIEFANEEGVRIVPVCERNGNVMKLAKIDPSQALPVRDEIAGNFALNDPLHQRGYIAEHVVGVIIGEKGATLYVHKGA